MKDNEIIKALEDLLKNFNGRVVDFMAVSSAIDLINRQRADNERLKKLLAEADVNYNKCAKRFYIEAVKEFAERLKGKSTYDLVGFEIVHISEIDDLVKEMVGDAE